MANVLFSRTDSPSTKPITDGQIIFDTSGNGKMYLDNGTTRLEMGGAIDVDTTLDATSTNPIQNKGVAGVMLSELEEVRGTTKKGFLTDALATKTLDAKIGTTDISSIGDGTVTGAISDVNDKLGNYGNDIVMGKLLSINDNYILDLFKNAPVNYNPTFGQLNIGGPIVAYIMQKHSDKYGGAVIVFGYNNLRPIYYHIVNDTIDAEYYLLSLIHI